jgi:hypothetical protein
VFRWLSAHNEFRDQYARAREAQANSPFDEIIDIANTPIEGSKTKVDKDGNVIEVSKGDMIEHRRLQIDARKRVAGKPRPKVSGDRLDVDLTGAPDFVVSARTVSKSQLTNQSSGTNAGLAGLVVSCGRPHTARDHPTYGARP